MLAGPLPAAPRPGLPWPGIAIAVVGILVLALGLLDRSLPLDAAGLVIIAIGVFSLTQPRAAVERPLQVGTMRFPDRRSPDGGRRPGTRVA